MKPLVFLFQCLVLALLVGCTTGGQIPQGTSDPQSRWRRDNDGYITSGITSPEWRIEWKQEGNSDFAKTDHPKQELHDPLEDIPEFKRAFADADRQAAKKIANRRGQLGAIHEFWREKKKILREKYRIDWKSPEELNPMTSYD